MTYRSSKLVHRCNMCMWQKEKRKKDNERNPTVAFADTIHVIRSKFCIVGGLWEIALSFEFHENRLSIFLDVVGRNLAVLLHWPLAYTTTWTTIQALIILVIIMIIMVALCNRADYYIFALWFLSSSSFFPCLISAVKDWMSTILPHMVWP